MLQQLETMSQHRRKCFDALKIWQRYFAERQMTFDRGTTRKFSY